MGRTSTRTSPRATASRPEVQVRIQHHPARAALLPPLEARLSPLPTEIIEHSSAPPSPWAGYQLCLKDIPECTHLLILQDDTRPVDNFAAQLEAVARRHPESPVCLFLAHNPRGAVVRARKAMARGERYAVLYPGPFVPIVAVLWPRHKAEEFREWSESGVRLPGHPSPRADDGVLAKWVRATRQGFLVACPSLVEHLDVPSVKGLRNAPSAWKAAFLAEGGVDYGW